MNFAVSTNKKTRIELHTDAKSAAKSKKQWEKMGFATKIYFVNETTDDLMTGLEISCNW